MKKCVICALLAAILSVTVCGFYHSTAFAESAESSTAETDYKTSQAYAFLREFLAECPYRSGAEKEKEAAELLCYGKTDSDDSLKMSRNFASLIETAHSDAQIKISEYMQNGDVTGYNAEVRFNSRQNTAAQVIIGAHFDSVGNGANDNASGIAALYLTMQNIAALSNSSGALPLPFNVVFVVFGGEEQGLLGSAYYLENMSSVERQNTLVMFNLDCVGGGDNLYLFCENKPTDLASFILTNVSGPSTIVEKPYAEGVFPLDVYGYGYYEFIQGSDYTPFRLQNIPTAMFFAGNFSWWKFAESADSSKNVMNTNSDTLANMDKFYGAEFINKTETVAQTLTATLVSEEFLSVAQNAKNQLVNNNVVFNTLWPTLVAVALLGLTVLLGWLYYRKLQKRAVLGTAQANEQKSVFSTPDAEDIFDFDEKK